NAQETRMSNQIVKRHLHKRFEEGPQPLSLRDERFIHKPGDEHTHQERIQFLVSTLEYLRIEAKLLPIVAKEQFLIVAREMRDGIDPRTIEAMLREDDFCRLQNRLTAGLSPLFFCF